MFANKWIIISNTWKLNLVKRKEVKERRKKNKLSLELSVMCQIFWKKQKYGNGLELVSDSKSFTDFKSLLRNWLQTLQLEVWDFLESLREHKKIIMSLKELLKAVRKKKEQKKNLLILRQEVLELINSLTG